MRLVCEDDVRISCESLITENGRVRTRCSCSSLLSESDVAFELIRLAVRFRLELEEPLRGTTYTRQSMIKCLISMFSLTLASNALIC